MSTIPKFRILRNSNQGYRLPYELLDLIENKLIESEKYLLEQSREWVATLMPWHQRSFSFNIDALEYYPWRDTKNIMRDTQIAYVMALIQILDGPIESGDSMITIQWYGLIIELINNRYDLLNLLLSKVKNTILELIQTKIDIEEINIINDIEYNSVNSSLDKIENNEKYFDIISNYKLYPNGLYPNGTIKEYISSIANLVLFKLIRNNRIDDLHKLLSFPRIRKRLYDELNTRAIKYKKDIKSLKDNDLLGDLEPEGVLDLQELSVLAVVKKIHHDLRNNSKEYADELPVNL